MSNSSNGHDFEKLAEQILREANFKFISQPRLKLSGKRLDLIISASNEFINISCKRSLRERYELCAVENALAQEVIPNMRTIILTADTPHQIELTKNKINNSIFLQMHIMGIIHIDQFTHWLAKRKSKDFYHPQLQDYFKSYSKVRSNL